MSYKSMALILILACLMACAQEKEQAPAPPPDWSNIGFYLMEVSSLIAGKLATVAYIDTNLNWVVIDSAETRKVLEGFWER